MKTSRLSLKHSLLLSAVFFAAGALAQDTTTSADDDTTTEAATTSTSDDATTKTTATAATTTASTTTSDDSETSETTSMPALTTSSTSESANADMPTLSSTSSVNTAVPTYPAPTVPPTSNAPYMQVSSMPDGTVFIAVGAILGLFGLALVLWRAIIVCMLHRSVEKAAMAQHIANDKAAFPAPPAPFYKYSDQDSSQNVGAGRGVRRTTRGPIPSATPSQSNLFFSPTAAGGGNRESMYRDNPTNRDSSYRDSRFLPAGFYAAGQSSPHNVDGPDSSSISLDNLRPSSRGHAAGMSGSPGFGPQRSLLEASSSNVNLTAAPEGRAPSAYLDDMLAEHPEMFPPSGSSSTPTRTDHPNYPYRQNGRF